MLNLEKSQLKSEPLGWSGGYRSQKSEYTYQVENISGEIPSALHGTLFRNIPAMLDINGSRAPSF